MKENRGMSGSSPSPPRAGAEASVSACDSQLSQGQAGGGAVPGARSSRGRV